MIEHRKEGILNLLDGTKEGQLKVRVFCYLNDRKEALSKDARQANYNVSEVFSVSPETSDAIVSEWFLRMK